MAGIKISQLSDGGALQSTDAFPVARGTFTRKILGAQLLDPIQSLNTRMNDLSSGVTSSLSSLSASTITMLVPTGAVMTFPSTSAPTGWLALSGQQVSRTTYSALWSFAQSSGNLVTNTNWTSLSAYGSFSDGDGSTTFRLPDLRGHFVRGSGTHTDGTAAGSFGVKQNDAFQAHQHTFRYPRKLTDGQNGSDHTVVDSPTYTSENTTAIVASGVYGAPRVDSETRPKNIALLYCIKH